MLQPIVQGQRDRAVALVVSGLPSIGMCQSGILRVIISIIFLFLGRVVA